MDTLAFMLIVYFYLCAGLLFGKVSHDANMFPKFSSFIQVLFWPSFVIAWAVIAFANGDLKWMLKYFWFKVTKRC